MKLKSVEDTSMKRLPTAVSAVLVFSCVAATSVRTVGRFDQKLPIDRQIVHALNRLTFGSRPGDVEQIRRMGLEKWIDLQLHPERLPENPVLESKTKQLGTLQMAMW